MTTAPDQSVRKQALDINQSFIVQAPAGSGKTELLIQRYLNLLAHCNEPEEVLAITFTRKAAAEMRHRVLAALQSVENTHGEPESEHERQTWQLATRVLEHASMRQWNLSAQPARLRIMTIDALNGSLVRRMPWQAGTGSDVMIEQQPQYLYEEAAWQTLNLAEIPSEVQPALKTLLLHLDNNDRRVCRLLIEMLERRDHWLRYLMPLKQDMPIDVTQVRAHLSHMFENVIEDQLHHVMAVTPGHIADEMVRVAAIGGKRLSQEGVNKSHVVLKDAETFPEPGFQSVRQYKALADLYLTQKNQWRSARSFNKTLGFPPDGEEKPAIGDLYQRLQNEHELLQALADIRCMPEQIYDDAQWDVLEALITLLPVAVSYLKVVFQQHSAMDFVEQALAAQAALGQDDNITDLALKLDYQLKHILMDEFQDTSYAQFHLLEKLITGWQEGDGRSLFLVGDPMQSIYGFREADVSGFLKVRDHGIGPVRPKSLVLEANFRSTPQLMQWFNTVFPDVLASEDDLTLGAVRYTPAIAAKDSHPQSGVTVHAGLERNAYAEAELIIGQIEKAIAQDEHHSIGVLVRSRSQLYDLFSLLVQTDINFQAVEILPLQVESVIHDLLSVTRTLLHRHDRVAWLAVLRAPWCALTLDSLHRIVADHPKSDLWSLINDAVIQDRFKEAERQRLQHVIDSYALIVRNGTQLTLRTQVEWLWQALGGNHCHAHPQALEDAAAYLDLLDELEQKAVAGGQAVTDKVIRTALKTRFSSGASYAGSQVQLMTIHKSKGLEFDTVILPALERGTGKDSKKLMVWHEELGSDFSERLLLAPIHAPGGNDQSYEFVRTREKHRQAYEAQRLLYVAMTRARQHLHLFASLNRTKDGELHAASRGSFLAMLEPHVMEHFADLVPESHKDEEALEECTDIVPGIPLYRVPLGWVPRVHGSDIQWQLPNDMQAEAGRIEPDRIEYSWVGEAARIIGTVTHQYLHLLGQRGLAGWNTQHISTQRDAIHARLLSAGLPQAALEDAVEKVIRALTNVIHDERAQWIFEPHTHARSEYAVSGVIDGRIVNRVIDRTFIDKEGTRWIIDYKTSTHEGGDPQVFLDEEQRRYSGQLSEYAELLSHLGDEPVRHGLYFPLMEGWREM